MAGEQRTKGVGMEGLHARSQLKEMPADRRKAATLKEGLN